MISLYAVAWLGQKLPPCGLAAGRKHGTYTTELFTRLSLKAMHLLGLGVIAQYVAMNPPTVYFMTPPVLLR